MVSPAEMEQHYYEITELYDLAEELVDTIESELVQDQELQMQLVEPLINEIGDAADMLSEEFITIAENQGQGKPQSKTRIEGALRKIYTAIDAYHKRVNASLGESNMGFRNIADPIVKKITRQVEVIVTALVDFVALSLDRIMQKSHVEELKKRQEKIAMMIYAAQHQQGT